MSSSSSAQAGAMNLLEKYTTLNRGMDETRRENTRIQAEKETIRQRIQGLRQERADMQAKTVQARDETVDLHRDIQDALAHTAELEREHKQALLEKMQACRQLEFAKNYVEEQRQGFLGASRDFRTTCKRMRLSASAVGEDTAASKAFLERHHVIVDDDDANNDFNNEKDFELQEAIAEHERQQKAREEAEKALEDVRAREAVSSERSARRLERKNQLLAQLDRIRNDNVTCENRLRELDEQTKEARELAHSHETDLNRRLSSQQRGRPQSFAPAPTITPPNAGNRPISQQQSRPRNPYSNTSTSRSNRPPNNAPAPVGSWTNSNDAQPHLNRRRRMDRQFGGVALDIIRGGETEDCDEVGGQPASYAPRVSESNHSNGATSRLSHGWTTTSRSALLDSDDDDDDELLNYSVFPTR